MFVRGQGDGDPIVLLHGFPGSASDWDEVARHLAPGRRVLIPDLLGFGSSDTPTTFEELWVDTQAAALTAALDGLGVHRATFVGHDYGGPVALAVKRAQPERVAALALVSTNVFADTPVPLPLAAVRWPIVGDTAARLLFSPPSLAMLGRRATRGRRPTRNTEREARTIRTIFTGVLRNLAELYAPLESSLAQHGTSVVVWGDKDPIFPLAQAERTAAALRSELVVLEDTGHFVPVERPAELAAVIERL
jgi:pimeloyl-ACP methyl ester carboxylesterase